MSDLGIGLFGAGTFGAGYGAPFTINSTAARVFLDAQGIKRNAAQIDPKTGDFVRDPQTGIHRGMDSVAQQVYLSLRTVRGSSIVPAFGFGFKSLTISETTAQKARDAVNEALQYLVDAGLVEIVSIDVKRIKITAIEIKVQWRTLTNGETNTTLFSPV